MGAPFTRLRPRASLACSPRTCRTGRSCPGSGPRNSRAGVIHRGLPRASVPTGRRAPRRAPVLLGGSLRRGRPRHREWRSTPARRRATAPGSTTAGNRSQRRRAPLHHYSLHRLARRAGPGPPLHRGEQRHRALRCGPRRLADADAHVGNDTGAHVDAVSGPLDGRDTQRRRRDDEVPWPGPRLDAFHDSGWRRLGRKQNRTTRVS